ncbi:MAG: CsgG/HfaB family protein [Candidatus Margulisiibacteriota bacterium]
MKIWFLCIVFVGLLTTESVAAIKKIAVLDFEDTSIASTQLSEVDSLTALAIMRGYRPPQPEKGQIGRSVSNILVTELVKDGTYKVIERSQLEQILNEQKLGKEGAISAADAARIGKILGVSAVVMGSVTEFNTKTERQGVLVFQRKVIVATTAVNARVVDTSTAEILFAIEGRGQEEETNIKVADIGNSSSGAREAILSAATKKAMTGIIQQLKDNAVKLKDPVIEGFVANVDQKNVLIDVGSDHGLVKDQKLYVIKVVKEIKSRTTGEVIKKIVNVVGELQVADLDKKSSTCLCVTGSCSSIKENDMVSTSK